MANPFEDVKVIYTKQGELDKNASMYLINRIISFDPGSLGVSERVNQYVFTVDKDIIKRMFEWYIPKQKMPYIKYIKKPDEKKSEKFDEIIQLLRSFYHWSDKEYGMMLPLLDKLLEDKKQLKKALRFFGCEDTLYKKYDIEIVKEERKKGLGVWI